MAGFNLNPDPLTDTQAENAMTSDPAELNNNTKYLALSFSHTHTLHSVIIKKLFGVG